MNVDKKLIDFALQEGLIQDPKEVEGYNELDIECMEMAYEIHLYAQGKQKLPHTAVTISENGERVLGDTYYAYIGESQEEAIAREANENRGKVNDIK